MTYSEFRFTVIAQSIPLAQLRFDEPPLPKTLRLMDECGAAYERFVLRWERSERARWEEDEARLENLTRGSMPIAD